MPKMINVRHIGKFATTKFFAHPIHSRYVRVPLVWQFVGQITHKSSCSSLQLPSAYRILMHNVIQDPGVKPPRGIFDDLSPEERALVAPLFKVMVYPENTIIFTQGFPARYLYWISRGEVLIRYEPEDGPALTVARVQPGGVFGWSAALMRPTYSSSAITVHKTEVLRLYNQDLRDFYQENPRVGRRLAEILAEAIAKRLDSPQGKILALLENNLKLSASEDPAASTPYKEDAPMTGLAEEKMRITVLISNLSAYIEQFHGGFVELVDYDGKMVKVRMGGACATCDLLPNTLHGWVEGTLRQFFPHIEGVEAVD